jgi:adenylate cyclase
VSELERSPEVTAVTDWIIEQGLLRVGFETLVEGFCERLVAIGLPLWRGYVSARTLHPTISRMGCSWRPGRGLSTDVYIHRLTPPDAYMVSPFKHMADEGLPDLRLRLDPSTPVPFPLVAAFRDQGATDYLAQRVHFGIDGEPDPDTGLIASWTTTSSSGFSNWDVAVLRHLMPRLGLALQSRLSHDISVNLLDAYVGPEAGRRILDGEIRRGMLETIGAVILFADLRGFTAIVDRSDGAAPVEALNAYFDGIVPSIVATGGQVLKFMGDGLLATFPLRDQPADEVCERALQAAAQALAEVDALRTPRSEAGQPVMELDLALHLGDVLYGNVGSAARLDFTVIGPAVNEAARIEALCEQHGHHLLMSETFAQAATRSTGRLVSIGRFALRGVRSAQSIFALDGL